MLTLEFPTCPRAQKSEFEQQLLTLKFLGTSNVLVYLVNTFWCHTERIKVLDNALLHNVVVELL